jgi:hypothetical protein
MLLKRIEAITGPLAFLAWIVLITVAAQSVVPPIAPAWRWPIAGGAIAALLSNAALCLWNDYRASRPKRGGRNES